jgi:2-polyprenyl-3-methyl-5-hydroxy-6-metoxy-1,4-benzoquinol methylase
LPKGAQVLDAGCGSHLPSRIKEMRPDLRYTGIDIVPYNNKNRICKADKFIVTSAANFAAAISIETEKYDAVMSNHNLEHCGNREETLANMVTALKNGGCLFLAFPCEHSIDFPNKVGTLNYYDDTSHKNILLHMGVLWI